MKESFAQLLVHLDFTSHGKARLAVARAIAQAQGAAVSALYAVTPTLLGLPFAPDGGPNVASVLEQIDRERREPVKAAFDLVAATEDPRMTWAETTGFPIESSFAHQAFYADLLVLGQYDPSNPAYTGVPSDFVESVLVASGKPVLVLPYAGAPASVGETVVIAWKPTREAARAVAAAVPLLQRAKRVHVLSWGDEEHEIQGAGLSLEGYLKLRGVEATWHRTGGAEPEQPGELLLSRAFDLQADLMVMGCYGHSRAREWVLGGASRTVLRSMTLPVLMAH